MEEGLVSWHGNIDLYESDSADFELLLCCVYVPDVFTVWPVKTT